MNTQLKLILKKLFKILSVVIIAFFTILGILASIAIYNYNKNVVNTNFGSSQYAYALSEKTALDIWQKNENYFNTEFNKDRKMGEFRINFFRDEITEGKLKTYENEESSKKITGTLYTDGKNYQAEIDTLTLEITINEDPINNWDWRWYNWLGIKLGILDKRVRQAQEEALKEIVNSPLPVKK